MQAAEHGDGNQLCRCLDMGRPVLCDWRLAAYALMGPAGVVVVDERAQQALQVALIQDDDVVQDLPAAGFR